MLVIILLGRSTKIINRYTIRTEFSRFYCYAIETLMSISLFNNINLGNYDFKIIFLSDTINFAF